MSSRMSQRSSKSAASLPGLKKARSEFSLYGDNEENPFRLPSDELIFTFKETEKDRKIIERERNK